MIRLRGALFLLVGVALGFLLIGVLPVSGKEQPPPPLLTHATSVPPVATAGQPTSNQSNSPEANPASLPGQSDPPPPPPPLPSRPTPTPVRSTASLQPSITSVVILRRTGDRMIPTQTLNRGDRARFVMAWKVNERSALGATGDLRILKDGHVLYHRSMRGRPGALGGTMHAEIHFKTDVALGRLIAQFTLHLGNSVQRSVAFTMAQGAK